MTNQQLIDAVAVKLPSKGFGEKFERLYRRNRERLIEEFLKYYGQGNTESQRNSNNKVSSVRGEVLHRGGRDKVVSTEGLQPS
jgi:hypothetical protein